MSEKLIFEDFKTSFEKQNRVLKISILTITLLLISILLLTLMNRVYFLKANMGMFSTVMPLEEICYQASLAIAKGGTLNPHLLSDDVVAYFKKNPKDRFDIKKLYSPILIDNENCKIIFTDNTSNELRGFVLRLDSNKKHTFGAKVHNLDEVSADKTEAK